MASSARASEVPFAEFTTPDTEWELTAPAFHAILEPWRPTGAPWRPWDPRTNNILNIVDQTYYAYLRKYAKRAGLGFSR
jgi:hypothetical protein